MAEHSEQRAQRLTVNLRKSVGEARSLSFALAGVSGHLGGAVNSASQLAEGIARVSKNAKIAASATGIGAIVALIGSAVAFVIDWKDTTKEINREMASIARKTAIINAKGAGDTRKATELEIADAMEEEVLAAQKLETIFRKFPQLQQAIKDKADAARRAAKSERDRSFEDRQFEQRTKFGLEFAGLKSERDARRAEAAAEMERQLREMRANREGFSPVDVLSWEQDIKDEYLAALMRIDHDIAAPFAFAVGQSIANSLADGIATAVRTGNLGEGFKALTGGILMALGSMMQAIGTEVLIASQFMLTIKKALAALMPEIAIPAALGLIAFGGVLQGLGASMGGRGGGGRGAGSSYGYGGGSTTTYIGVSSPAPAPNVIGLAPQPVNNFYASFFGPRDPKVQREFLELMRLATARGGV